MPGDETDQELKALGKRIHQARREAGLLPENQPDTPSANMASGAQVGLDLAVTTLVCTFVGLGLDRWLDTMPLCMLTGLFLGFAAGMWKMYRSSLT